MQSSDATFEIWVLEKERKKYKNNISEDHN